MRGVFIFVLGFVAGAGCFYLYERRSAEYKAEEAEEAWAARVDSLRNALLDAFVGGFSGGGDGEVDAGEVDDGITYLDTPGECVTDRDLKVGRVLESGNAIARGVRSWLDGVAIASGVEVLLLRKDGDLYYSGQVGQDSQRILRQAGRRLPRIVILDLPRRAHREEVKNKRRRGIPPALSLFQS